MVKKRSSLVAVEEPLLKAEAELVECALNERGVYEAIIDLAVVDKYDDGTAEGAYSKFIQQTGLDWFCPLYCDFAGPDLTGSVESSKKRFGFSFIIGSLVGVADGLFRVQHSAVKQFSVQSADNKERGVKVRLCANVLDGTSMEIKTRPSSRGKYVSSSAFMMETKKPSVAAGAAAGAFVAGAPGALVGASIQRSRRREAITREQEMFASAPIMKLPTQALYLDFLFVTSSVFIDKLSSKAGDKFIDIERDKNGMPLRNVSKAEFIADDKSFSSTVVYAPAPRQELLIRAAAGKEFHQNRKSGLRAGDDMFESPDHFCEIVSEGHPLTDIVRPLITKARKTRWKQARQAQLALVRYARDHHQKKWNQFFDVMPSETVSERLLDPETLDEERELILCQCLKLLDKTAQIRKLSKERDEKIRDMGWFDRLRGRDFLVAEEYNKRIEGQNKALNDEAEGFVQLRLVMP